MKDSEKLFGTLVEDVLVTKFSKDGKTNQKVLKRIQQTKSKKACSSLDLIDVFGVGYEDAVMVSARNASRPLERIYYLDAHSGEAYEFSNLAKFRI